MRIMKKEDIWHESIILNLILYKKQLAYYPITRSLET